MGVINVCSLKIYDKKKKIWRLHDFSGGKIKMQLIKLVKILQELAESEPKLVLNTSIPRDVYNSFL